MLPILECADPTGLCCTHVFGVGEQIRDTAVAAINNPDCYDGDCDAPNVDGIVTVGSGRGYPPDLVIVSLLTLGPSVKSQDVRQNTRATVQMRATWQVQLVESGWITLVDSDGAEPADFPDPARVHALAMASYSHAEQMYRAVANQALAREFGCGRMQQCWVNLGDLTPLEPEGHNVGWRFQLGVGIDMSRPCGLP